MRYLLFFLIATSELYVAGDARIYPSELVLVFIALFYNPKYKYESFLDLKKICQLGAVWVLGILLSNYVNDVNTLDALKGSLRAIFLLVDVIAIAKIVRADPRSKLSLILGFVCSGFVGFLFAPNAYSTSQPWKFALAIPTTLLVAFALDRLNKNWKFNVTVLAALTVFHFVLGTRNLVISVIFATALIIASAFRREKSGVRTWTLIGIFMSFFGAAATLTFDALARVGYFGDVILYKINSQSQGLYGSLITGRPEIWLSLETISKNPIFGIGTFQKPELSIQDSVNYFMENLGYQDYGTKYATGAFSFHSEFLGMMAESGILAIGFWGFVAYLLAKTANMATKNQLNYPVFTAVLTATAIWDFLFSPFGAEMKIWLAATIVLIASNRKQWSENENFHTDDKFQPNRVSR